MAVAALITWLITAVGGFVMLFRWMGGGGHKPGSGSRLPAALVFTHFGLAVVGLVLWIIFLVNDSEGIAWAAFVVLLPVALAGFTMFARWLGSRSNTAAPESRFPMAVVLAHGLFAAVTLVLVLLAAVDASA
jgi:hypothetical protein